MNVKRRYTEGYRKLVAWQEAKKLTVSIYAFTKTLPPDEKFHLVQQMRRATSSVMANLAEGSAMPTKVHRNAYYSRARGSAVELDNFVELCLALQLMSRNQYEDFTDHIARVTYLITKLIQSK